MLNRIRIVVTSYHYNDCLRFEADSDLILTRRVECTNIPVIIILDIIQNLNREMIVLLFRFP